MKTYRKSGFAGVLMTLILISPSVLQGQGEKAFLKKYAGRLPARPVIETIQKYRMTAIYTNRDLYGNFTGKIKVSGEYTCGLANGLVMWNNAFISSANSFPEPFQEGNKLDYIENFKYLPSYDMLKPDAFKNFPNNPESVYAKNLVWDMMTIENFAWDYADSLKLNRNYVVPDIKGEFEMADIGSYSHTSIQICWTGISVMNDNLCAVLEYRAPDNKIELAMDQIKTKGTEQYWGTTWVSLKTGLIESAVMYGGTIQEIEVKGLENKFLVKTIRELRVDKIQ